MSTVFLLHFLDFDGFLSESLAFSQDLRSTLFIKWLPNKLSSEVGMLVHKLSTLVSLKHYTTLVTNVRSFVFHGQASGGVN